MKWRLVPVFLTLLLAAVAATEMPWNHTWTQWGANSQHSGFIKVNGQPAQQKLAEFRYDPFVKLETEDFFGIGLPSHYQVPLIEGDSVYMEFKTGTWVACHPPTAWRKGAHCGPNAWDSEIWNEKRLVWKKDKLVKTWTFTTDWKPEPNGFPSGLSAFEPVFHPVLTKDFLYVPGFAGTIWKVNKENGKAVSHINPFGTTLDPHTFVAGPLTADDQGNIYFNVIKLADATDPWYTNDVQGAWLAKIAPDDTATTATFADLIPGAPKATDNCPNQFFDEKTLPWPPSKDSKPPEFPCGSQRPGVNIAPAVAPDGTIYTISRSHYYSQANYLVAVNPNLTPKWQASLSQLLQDGCGVLVPIATHKKQPNACREGANVGVDPTTNQLGSGWIVDAASSSPSIAPDGSILFAAVTDYDNRGGHTFKFSSDGKFLGAYPAGWDLTPAVYPHDGTYSIVLKDNHYGNGLYCGFPNDIYCKPLSLGPYFITQTSADLKPEWQYKDPTIDKHHPLGYEWCVNAAAIDKHGNVFVNSEDGNLYQIGQGGKLLSKIFLKLAIGAAYTPSSIGADGKIYTQNDGLLFVVGKK